jgi:hypothetical protein
LGWKNHVEIGYVTDVSKNFHLSIFKRNGLYKSKPLYNWRWSSMSLHRIPFGTHDQISSKYSECFLLHHLGCPF